MKTLTLPEAVRIAEEIVDGHEDFMYTAPGDGGSCVYQYAGEPSCGVGCILHAWGVPIDVLAELDALDKSGIGSRDAGDLLLDHGFSVGQAQEFLAFFQNWQDVGARWGAALKDAKTHAGVEEEAA